MCKPNVTRKFSAEHMFSNETNLNESSNAHTTPNYYYIKSFSVTVAVALLLLFFFFVISVGVRMYIHVKLHPNLMNAITSETLTGENEL